MNALGKFVLLPCLTVNCFFLKIKVSYQRMKDVKWHLNKSA